MVIVGDEAGVPGGDGGVDEVQLVTVMSNAWSASSISSREGGEDRLEFDGAAVASGNRLRCRLTAKLDEQMVSGGARDQMKEKGTS
jgi:hypothetical protein